MIKSLVVAAAAFTIGLAGYAFAQETVPGAPAGTAPMTPAPGTPAPIPGMMTRRSGQGRTCITMSHHHHYHQVHHPPMAAPALRLRSRAAGTSALGLY